MNIKTIFHLIELMGENWEDEAHYLELFDINFKNEAKFAAACLLMSCDSNEKLAN